MDPARARPEPPALIRLSDEYTEEELAAWDAFADANPLTIRTAYQGGAEFYAGFAHNWLVNYRRKMEPK
jgi:hypothetical protein